jgi:very-short-patch-repair endonuclease
MKERLMLSPATVLSANSAGLSSIVVWVVVILFAVLAIRFLTGRFLRDLLQGSRATPLIPDNIALRAIPVLSEAEARFLSSLEMAVDGQYHIWPQLPLWTFIETRSSNKGTLTSFTNRIDRKRVDFCLIDRHTWAVQTAIELDDRSHGRLKTQKRDALVEAVLQQAGVPLVRIPVARAYDPQTIRKQLGLDELEVRKLPGISLAR